MIAVIDFGAGNLRSVVKALASLGYEAVIATKKEQLITSRLIVLPGVGSAPQAIKRLNELKLIEVLGQLIRGGHPFLGICLGMEILFDWSEEGDIPCLGFLHGKVKRFPMEFTVPHMGWNSVRFKRYHPILEGLPQESYFYFVHSYYVEVEDSHLVIGETEYEVTFPSFILDGKLIATQFHPEKSGRLGLKLLSNILNFWGI